MTLGSPDPNGSTVVLDVYTVDNANVDSDLTDFPLLVRVISNSRLGAVCAADGSDVELLDSSGDVIPFDRISFTATGGVANGLYRTKLLVDHDADTPIYVSTGASADQEAAESVYTGATAHWYLGEASGTCYDSTSNNHDLTASGSPSYGATAKVGNGVTTTSGYLTTPFHSDFQLADGNFSLFAWVKWASAPIANWWEAAVAAMSEGTSPGVAKWFFSHDPGSSGRLVFHYWKGTNPATDAVVLNSSTWNPTPGTFHLVGITRSGSTWTFYADGTAIGTASEASSLMTFTSAPLTLGYGEPGTTLNGTLNDVWFVKGTAWSAAQIKFLYHNTNSADAEGSMAADTLDAVVLADNNELGISGPTNLTMRALILNARNLTQVWNGMTFVSLSSIGDSAAWRACLIDCQQQTLNDATGTTLYVGSLPNDLLREAWYAEFYTGRFPSPGNVPYGHQDGQSPADQIRRFPASY